LSPDGDSAALPETSRYTFAVTILRDSDSLIIVRITEAQEDRMKRALTFILAAGALALSGVAAAHGGNVGFTVSIGAPVYAPPPVYYAPPPVYYAPPPVYYPPPRVYYAPPVYYGGPAYYGGPRYRHGHGHGGRHGRW
jgi:hypothetical protein